MGRDAQAAFLHELLSGFKTTFHLVGNHVIDLVDEDHATGVVYCRAEHEVGKEWIIMALQYWDRYERHDGHWYFRSRKVHTFYAADVGANPLDLDTRYHFPGAPMGLTADLPDLWETWGAFWATKSSD